MRRACILISLSCALCAAPARAQPTPPPSAPRVVMRLDFSGPPGCADARPFRLAVGAGVRTWDPFAPDASHRLVVIVKRTEQGYEGAAALHDATDRVAWTIPMPAAPSCADLVQDLAVTVAFKIDPPHPPRPAAPAEEMPPPAKPPEPPPPPKAPEPPRSLRQLRLGAGIWLDFGTAPATVSATPAVVPGVTLDAGGRFGRFSVAGELRWNPSVRAGTTNGLATSRILGAVLPCGHVGERITFTGCFVGEGGWVQWSPIGLMGTATSGAPYAAGGVRAAVEIHHPDLAPFYVRGALNLVVAAKPTFAVYTEKGGYVAGFAGGIGLGAGAAF